MPNVPSRKEVGQAEKREARGTRAKLEPAEGGYAGLLAGFFTVYETSEVVFRFGVAPAFAPFIVFLDHVKNSLNGSKAGGGFVVSKLRRQLVEEASAHELNYNSVAVAIVKGVVSEG